MVMGKRSIVTIPEEETLSLMQNLEDLGEQIGGIPEDFLSEEPVKHKPPNCFDANMFFEVFDKVKLREGYTLDYVYAYHGVGGQPILFTREITSPPIISIEELKAKFPNFTHESNLITQVEFDKSPSGYFQFDVFNVVVHQFYLFWHAKYNDLCFIFVREQLEDVLRILDEARSANKNYRMQNESSRKINESDIRLNPRVKMEGNCSARVTTVTFTAWGGLYYRHGYLRWPNTIERVERELIAEYDCGIRF
jgi:hypothetical protein